MNEYDKALMKAKSIKSDYCVFCGRVATNEHQIVFRSHGGHNGATISVCGLGNAS